MNPTELKACAQTDLCALRPTFDTLLNEVDGIFANARIAYALTLVDRAIAHEEWAQAVALLLELADKLARRDLPTAAWRELLWAASWCGLRAPTFESIADIETLFERFATQAWPKNFANSQDKATSLASKRRAMPWDIAELFAMADQGQKYLNGLQLAGVVQTVFPEFPLGHYARAHFADRLLHVGHHNLPRRCTPKLIAKDFKRAQALAAALDMPELVDRTRLRGGAILLRSGESPEQGRALLREVEARELGRADRLWYAVAMAHSSFWLDRVRAADQVIALSDAPRRTQKTPQPQDADLEAATRYLLDSAPLQLQPLEVDRLNELVELLGPVEDAPHIAANLALRAHLNELTDLPLTRAGEPAPQMALNSGPAGQAAADFCQMLQNIFSADASRQPIPAPNVDDLARIEGFYPLAATTLSTLFAALTRDASRLATALGSLEGKLRITQVQPAELKPVGLIWPTLFAYLRAPRENEDPTTTKRIAASTREIFGRWVVRAPQPSYGWWTLSAQVLELAELDQPWPEAAAQCARRALQNGLPGNPELEDRVIATLVNRAVLHADDAVLREWLEVAEGRAPQA